MSTACGTDRWLPAVGYAVALCAGACGGDVEPRRAPSDRVVASRGSESERPQIGGVVPPDDVVARRDAGPADEPARTLRVCSWNIKKLGHGTATDYAAVTRVLEDNCDFSAVVEVMQRHGAHPGYEQLVQQLGAAWAGAVTPTPRPNTSSSNSEFYAFVWRHALVGPCAGWAEPRFAADNDGGAQGTGADNFAREPAYMCFEATAPTGERGADFVIATYHATWSNGHTPTIAAEVAHLPAVFQEMVGAVPGEADVLVVGDFNLRPASLAAAGACNDRTTGSGSTLNSSGAITANLYDHFVTIDSAAMSEMTVDADVLDLRSVAASPSEFYRTVSDHLPIQATVDVTRDDD